jgi:hypothetical protein
MNISLIDSLAQVILSLSLEEQRLLQQRLVQQPQQSRRVHSRRRVTVVESGDSFDCCVAEDVPASCTTTANSSNNSIRSQSQPLTIRSVEERSQKSLFIFRNYLQL